MPDMPRRTREYRSYLFDSRNWDGFRPREGDVVISTSYKSGTTWMQNLVLELLFPDGDRPAVSAVSPWLDRSTIDPDAVLPMLDAQTHRRVIKSHLPLDVVPYFPEVRYIVVARDARDVFMSFWNHYSNYTDAVIANFNDPATLIGPPMPRCPDELHDFWRIWIARGWFEGETEGWPHSGNLHHTQSWWTFRHLPNILFVHFQDMLSDLPAEVDRVAGHLGIALPEGRRERIAEAVSFAALSRSADRSAPAPPERMATIWQGGARTFFNKGTNGRWKGVLTGDELAMYEAAKVRVLTPDCAAFLENGRRI